MEELGKDRLAGQEKKFGSLSQCDRKTLQGLGRGAPNLIYVLKMSFAL